jgi:hypothetical protein
MGINASVSKVDLNENQYLSQFVGKTHIGVEKDDFWENLLQFNINPPTTR